MLQYFSEESRGNIADRRLLVNPDGPQIQTEFCCLSRGYVSDTSQDPVSEPFLTRPPLVISPLQFCQTAVVCYDWFVLCLIARPPLQIVAVNDIFSYLGGKRIRSASEILSSRKRGLKVCRDETRVIFGFFFEFFRTIVRIEFKYSWEQLRSADVLP